MSDPTTLNIPEGIAMNMAASALNLVDDAEVYVASPTPENANDLLASMRIMRHRIVKAMATMRLNNPQSMEEFLK
jgi:hypothetical protein